MDLVSICKALWRHKLVMLLVVLLTGAAAYYVIAVKPPVYQSTAEVLLVNGANLPTADQIARDPALGNINNPYADLGNLQGVADVVINKITSPAIASRLIAEGASPDFQAALSPDVGSPPIIIITGVGSTQASAVTCAELVATAARKQLTDLQAAADVPAKYMIQSIEYVRPLTAKSTVSPKMRELIAVIAVGGLLLLIAVSITDLLDRRRKADIVLAADLQAAIDQPVAAVERGTAAVSRALAALPTPASATDHGAAGHVPVALQAPPAAAQGSPAVASQSAAAAEPDAADAADLAWSAALLQLSTGTDPETAGATEAADAGSAPAVTDTAEPDPNRTAEPGRTAEPDAEADEPLVGPDDTLDVDADTSELASWRR